MHMISPEMQACIQECQNCRATCLGEAMNHCLEVGGAHVAPAHFRAMMTCAETCQTSANLMLQGSPLHPKMCGVCAEACAVCAASCEGLEGMETCAQQCRKCEEFCRHMAAIA